MTAVCPSCSLADRTAPVPTALRERDVPLERPVRRLLDVPPEPARGSRVSTLLLLLAAFSALQVLRGLVMPARSGSTATTGQLVAVVAATAVTAATCWASSALRRTADRKAERRRAAAAEGFFASLKRESMHGARWTSRSQVRLQVFRWISFYTIRRRHSTLGYLSPIQFEQQTAESRRITLAA